MSPTREKYALLASWDAVLGLDLEREATSGWAPTEEVLAHGGRARRGPRGARTTPRATGCAIELAAMGLEVMDTPAGTKVRPRS